jgi:hypothetical protein
MKEDAYITWSPFEEKWLKFFSAQGAAMLATNITVLPLVMSLLVWFWTDGREGLRPKRIRKGCIVLALVSILLWPAVFLSLPKIPVVVQTMPQRHNFWLHGSFIPQALDFQAREQPRNAATDFMPDIPWVRQQLDQTSDLRRRLGSHFQTNFFSGLPWHEEDSPGNYTIRQTAEGIEYHWYDIEGGEHVVPLFRKNQ